MAAAAKSTLLGPLGQIALTVTDLSRATAFYRDTLGLPLLFEVPRMSFFDVGGIRLLLGLPEPDAPRANGSSCLYYRVNDIRAVYDELAGRGVRFSGEPHLVARMSDHDLWLAPFKDGEGNVLALMSEVRRGADAGP